ncbi:30S ribosomal protein S5 [Candidatus Wolfebacteria bacterium]|nr:30S ribosomal protein S5 [Candidatus Wolfebacteria bacterium]
MQRRDFRQRDNERKSDFREKTLDLRRVTRVVAGGKRFRFRATVVIGDERGRVGLGIAKGLDAAQAIDKAKILARKGLFTVPLLGRSIPHEVRAKFSAARVLIRPAKEGHGLKAGGAPRVVLLLAGVRDATAKCLGATKNKLTNAMATIEALKQLKTQRLTTNNQRQEQKVVNHES